MSASCDIGPGSHAQLESPPIKNKVLLCLPVLILQKHKNGHFVKYLNSFASISVCFYVQ